ncbi:MAG: hypothetical protein FJ217_04375 [Ignavibacteria bacterium]|nr:hypothetical protein [Ignavibacteria bacterium]
MYKHTQIGYVIIVFFAVAAAVMIPVLTTSGRVIMVIPVVAAVAVLLALFSTLTVEVTDKQLRFKFGIGLFRKSVPLNEIVSWTETRNSWLYGWGLRVTFRGWLYNVSGVHAVEITLRTGKKFRLGTDEPEELSRALASATGRQ